MAANKFDSAKQQEFEAKVTEYTKAYRKAAKEEKWDDAIAAADKFGGLHASHAGQAQEMKFWLLLTGKKDYKAAYALGNTMVDGVYKDDAMNLNEMAWRIMTEDGIEQRDMALAFKAASRSNDLTKGENWQVLDTLARAYFEKGDFAKAVELQSKAVEKCDQDDAKEEMTETLTKYKEKAGKN
jgi:tetratricopeptide (TPR) repeat protein